MILALLLAAQDAAAQPHPVVALYRGDEPYMRVVAASPFAGRVPIRLETEETRWVEFGSDDAGWRAYDRGWVLDLRLPQETVGFDSRRLTDCCAHVEATLEVISGAPQQRTVRASVDNLGPRAADARLTGHIGERPIGWERLNFVGEERFEESGTLAQGGEVLGVLDILPAEAPEESVEEVREETLPPPRTPCVDIPVAPVLGERSPRLTNPPSRPSPCVDLPTAPTFGEPTRSRNTPSVPRAVPCIDRPVAPLVNGGPARGAPTGGSSPVADEPCDRSRIAPLYGGRP